MEVVRLFAVLFPLSTYLFLLGAINSGRRAYLTTGTRDLTALLFGLSGLILVGPVRLALRYFPPTHHGPLLWLLVAAVTLAAAASWVLLQPKRLVVYNLGADRFRELLSGIVTELEPEARLVGSHLILPRLGVELQIETFRLLRNVSLVAVGQRVDEQGWKLLEDRLADALGDLPVRPSPAGRLMTAMSFALLLALPVWLVAHDPQGVAQTVRRILEASFQ